MKKAYLFILLLAVLLIAGCSKSGVTGQVVKDTAGTVATSTVATSTVATDNSVNAGSNIIEITSAGFSPKELRIKQGDTVTWVNKDAKGHWPASAMHPTHEKYPGSSITKCGTAEGNSIFDACSGIKQDDSWSFTFNEKGTWGYHDHLNTALFGKIIVE